MSRPEECGGIDSELLATVDREESGTVLAACLIGGCGFRRRYSSEALAVEAIDQHQEDTHPEEVF